VAALLIWLCGGADLALRSEAVVAADFVRLLDVVEEPPAGAERAAALAHVYLGRAPEPGRVRLITVDDVRAELRLRGLGGLRLSGSRVLVTRCDPARRSEEDRFAAAVALEIRTRLAQEFPSESLGVRVLAPEELPSGASARIRRVVRLTSGALGPGEYAVELNDPTEVIRIFARVSRSRQAAFAARDLARGARLTHGDFKFDRVEVDGTEGYVTDLDGLEDGKALRAIAAGEPIRADMVKLRAVVRRGQEVSARSADRTLALNARALEDGSVGDRIGLELTQSKLKVFGRVISAGVVEIVGN
jgi:flagella basal body P-ring formation protein FlgA